MGYRDERETNSGSGTFIIILLIAVLAGGGLLTIALGGLFLFSVRQSRAMAAAEFHAADVARVTAERIQAVNEAQRLAAATVQEAPVVAVPAIQIEINAADETIVSGEKLTAAEIDDFVARVHGESPERSFAVRADKNASLEAVTALVAAIKRAGVTQIQLTTEEQP